MVHISLDSGFARLQNERREIIGEGRLPDWKGLNAKELGKNKVMKRKKKIYFGGGAGEMM